MSQVNGSYLKPVSDFFQQRKPVALVLLFAVLAIAAIGVVLGTTYAPVHDFLGTVGGRYTIGGISLLGLGALGFIFSPLGRKKAESEIPESPRGLGARRPLEQITIGSKAYQSKSESLSWILLPVDPSGEVSPAHGEPLNRGQERYPEVRYSLVQVSSEKPIYKMTILREEKKANCLSNTQIKG